MLHRGQGFNASCPGGHNLSLRRGDGAVPAVRPLASAVHVPPSCRASERDRVALVESWQGLLLWLLPATSGSPRGFAESSTPMGEEEMTRLEDELLPTMGSFLARINAIDQQLRAAQAEQEAQVEREREAMAGLQGVNPR